MCWCLWSVVPARLALLSGSCLQLSMLVRHVACSGFAAGAALDLGQSEDFQKCVGQGGTHIHGKPMCVQVRSWDHLQTVTLLSRNGKEHVWELLGLLCLAIGGLAFRFYLFGGFCPRWNSVWGARVASVTSVQAICRKDVNYQRLG